MKTLTLLCKCGARKTYHGNLPGDIMQQIDSAAEVAASRGDYDWQDAANDGDPMPRGHMRGRCPECCAKADALSE